jgi:hypothetical protein
VTGLFHLTRRSQVHPHCVRISFLCKAEEHSTICWYILLYVPHLTHSTGAHTALLPPLGHCGQLCFFFHNYLSHLMLLLPLDIFIYKVKNLKANFSKISFNFPLDSYFQVRVFSISKFESFLIWNLETLSNMNFLHKVAPHCSPPLPLFSGEPCGGASSSHMDLIWLPWVLGVGLFSDGWCNGLPRCAVCCCRCPRSWSHFTAFAIGHALHKNKSELVYSLPSLVNFSDRTLWG